MEVLIIAYPIILSGYHPDVEWAKQTLTTGEFWDAEGEDWVIAEETNE